MSGEKTKWIFETQPTPAEPEGGAEFTETLGAGAGAGTGAGSGATGGGDMAKTRMIEREDDRTTLDLAQGLGVEDELDPVVGWIVVIRGPGLGHSITIGDGNNIIGRSESNRVPLAFGDKLISSEDHLRIIYDSSSRSFLVTPGTGKNISRVNGAVVTQTTELTSGAVIDLSKTTSVRFQSFCDESFDWSDLEAPED